MSWEALVILAEGVQVRNELVRLVVCQDECTNAGASQVDSNANLSVGKGIPTLLLASKE